MLRDPARLMSAANLLAAGIVVGHQIGLSAGRRLDAFVERAGISIEPVTEAQVRIAWQAYIDFGQGNHPAGLNALVTTGARTTAPGVVTMDAA